MDIDSRTSPSSGALPGRHWENWVCVFGVTFLITALGARHATHPSPSGTVDNSIPLVGAANLQKRIDPNVAPWWELAQLPRIGEKTAKAIVALRDEGPAPRYRTVQDLDDVPRIGPKTLLKIAPFLRFPDPEVSLPN